MYWIICNVNRSSEIYNGMISISIVSIKPYSCWYYEETHLHWIFLFVLCSSCLTLGCRVKTNKLFIIVTTILPHKNAVYNKNAVSLYYVKKKQQKKKKKNNVREIYCNWIIHKLWVWYLTRIFFNHWDLQRLYVDLDPLEADTSCDLYTHY